MSMRRVAVAALAFAALAVAGCGDGGGSGPVTLRIYVSAPLQGGRAAEGQAIEDGARLALIDTGGRIGRFRISGVYLDDSDGGGWSIARTAANARRAAQDTAAIGFVGDVDSGATRVSLPITNQAEIAQVSPASGAVDLTRIPAVGEAEPNRYRPSDRQSFARVVPDDEVQARAAATWAKKAGGRRGAVVSDGSVYGDAIAAAFAQAAGGLGMSVTRIRTGRRGTEGLPQRLARQAPDFVYLATEPDAASPLLVSAARTSADIFGPDPLLTPAFLRDTTRSGARLRLISSFLDPSLLPPSGRKFVRDFHARYQHRPEPAAAYGYESMALLLDAIRRAGDDGDSRAAVIDALLSTTERRSILGTYSIDGNGDTTLDSVTGYRISDGLPVFPVRLKAPR